MCMLFYYKYLFYTYCIITASILCLCQHVTYVPIILLSHPGFKTRESFGFQEFGPRCLSVNRFITVTQSLKIMLRFLHAVFLYNDASQKCMPLCALAYYSASYIWTIMNTSSSRSLNFLLFAPYCVNLLLWIQLWKLVF